ncbi:MAG: CHAD domain-containing protein [Dehalobacterium sp.]|jgi:triphosphatase
MKDQEIELKLQLVNEDNSAFILDDDLFAAGKFWGTPVIHEFETTYYDTQDYRLMQAQCTYRIRRSGGSYIATVKDSGSSLGGLHVRNEWNVQLDQNLPDLLPFLNLPIGPKLSSLVGDDDLIPIFQTNFQRQVLDLTMKDGSLIELAIDRGSIVSGEKKASLAEVELELKKGQIVSLLELGSLLAQKTPMLLEEKSKYLRGLILADLPLHKELPTGFSWDDNKDLSHNLQELLLFSLQEIIKKQAIFLEAPADPETTHQLCAETLRLRALLSFLKPFYSRKDEIKIQERLKIVAEKFRYLREIDVMSESWYKFIQTRPNLFSSKSTLQRILQEEREKRQHTLTREISSGITTPLLLEVWAGLMKISFKNITDQDLQQHFQSLLLKRNNLSKRTNYQDLAQVHALRIQGKKLCYVLQTLGPVLREKDRALFDALKTIEDKVNQICAAQSNMEILRDLNEKYPSDTLAYESGVFSGWQQKRICDDGNPCSDI